MTDAELAAIDRRIDGRLRGRACKTHAERVAIGEEFKTDPLFCLPEEDVKTLLAEVRRQNRVIDSLRRELQDWLHSDVCCKRGCVERCIELKQLLT